MRLDHIGIACFNIEEYLETFSDFWQNRKIGKIIINERQRVKECFVVSETETDMEILEPLGNASPINTFLQKKGEGLHHLCYSVEDIGASINYFKAKGALVVCKPIPDIAFKNHMIAFIIMKGQLIELLQGVCK